GRDVGQLGSQEAAYLAGIIRSPQTADAAVAPARAAERRRLTLAAMVRAKHITPGQRDAVGAVPVESYVLPRTALAAQAQVAMADKGTQYFVEYVRRFLVDRYGENAVYGGGLRVKTTLDPGMQADAYDAVYRAVLNRPRDPAGALVALDTGGRVRAMVGGRDWNQSKVNLAVGRSGGGRGRQGGSTFKAFVLAETVH